MGWTVGADCVRESLDMSRGLMDGMDSRGRLCERSRVT